MSLHAFQRSQSDLSLIMTSSVQCPIQLNSDLFNSGHGLKFVEAHQTV